MKAIEMNENQCYNLYNNMYQRCYNKKIHTKKPWYADCTMCDDWLADKYNFYAWINDGNFYEVDGEPTVELDHNILVKDNKIYSPQTCIFAPKAINAMFGGSARKKQDNLPIGVVKTKYGFYKPQIKGYTKAFINATDAWDVYATHKKAHIITVADSYIGKIPDKLYDALINWQIDIND